MPLNPVAVAQGNGGSLAGWAAEWLHRQTIAQ